jgi:peptidoglycan hydrolase-like protein with peptidoglycan-binding domain
MGALLSFDPVVSNQALQQALAARGYYKGAIDGDIGPQTQAALVAFQKANGLPADGIIGPITEKALGLTATSDREIFFTFVAEATRLGVTGVGADLLPGVYMGPNTIHVGYGSLAAWGDSDPPRPPPQWLVDAQQTGLAARSTGQPIQVASNNTPTPNIVYPTPGVVPTPNLSPCDTGAAGCPTQTQPSLVVDETKTTALLSTNTGTVPLPRLRPGDYVISDQGGAVPIASQTTSGVPLPNVRPGSTVPLPNLSPCDTGASGCPTLQPGDVFQVTDQGVVVPLPHLRPGDIVPLPNLRPGDVVETTPPQTSGGSSGYFNLIIPLLFTNISIPIPIPKTATNVAQNPEGQTTIGGVPVPNLRPGEEAPGYVRSDNLVVISTYEDVQRVLAAQGYYKGAIDGIKGSQTTDAIEAFQKANGLTVDGIVGVQTLATLETVATTNNIPVGSTGGGTPSTAAGESTTIPRGPYGAEVLAKAILTGDPGRIAAAQKQVEDNANAEIQASCGGRILCLLSLKGNEDNLKAQATAQVQTYLTETLPEQAPGAVRQFKEKVQNDPSLIADLTPEQRQLLSIAFSNLPPVSGTQTSGSGSNTSTNVPLPNLRPGDIGTTITTGYYIPEEDSALPNSTSYPSLGNSIPNYSYYFSPNTLLGTSNTAPTYAPPTIPLYFSLDQEAQLSDAYVYQQPSSQESYFSGFPAPSSASSQSSSGSPVFLDTDHVLELYRNSGSSDLSNVWRTSVVITKDPTTGEYRIASIIPNPNDATQTPMSLDVSNILPLYYFVTQPGSSIVSQNWNLLSSRFSRLFWRRNSDTNGSNNTSGSDYTDTSFNVGTSDATPPLLLLCPGDTLPSGTQDCSFNFATSLVRKDFKDKMYWNVTDLDPGDVCTITSSPSTPEIPHAGLRFGASRGWSNLTGFGVTISQKTIVTLTCTTPKGTHSSVTKTLNLIPEVKEI